MRDMQKTGVYVRTDERGQVIDINSDGFIEDTTGWVKIDEGIGARFFHAQSQYLRLPLFNDDGLPNYRLANGKVVEA